MTNCETTFQILELLELTQGTKAKQELLQKHTNNDRLKTVFKLTNDPYENFFVAKVPKVTKFIHENITDDSLDKLFETLSRCSSREITGNAARDALSGVLHQMSAFEYKWASRIIQKKLRTGLGDSSIEKVWPGLISSFEVSLAETVDWIFENGKLKITTLIPYPCRVEPKWDGFRCVAIKTNDKVTLYARSGRVFDRAKKISDWLTKHMKNDWVLDGELIAKEWNDTASIIGSRKNHKEDESLQFHVFDCMSFEDWKDKKVFGSFSTRLRMLETYSVFSNVENSPVKIAEGRIVNNEEELHEYFSQCIDSGYEGVMVKKLDALYVFKRSDAVMKLKPIVSWDCVVTDVLPARDGTKWEGKYTILAVQVPGGGITRVGTGFSDSDREHLNTVRKKLVGKACEVEGQPPLTETGMIRFPRFVRWRENWDVSPEVKNEIEKIKGHM